MESQDERSCADVVREIETYALGLIAGMKIGPDLKRQNGA